MAVLLLVNTSPAVSRLVPVMLVVTLMTVTLSPGSSAVHLLLRATWLPGNSAVNLAPVMITDVATMETVMTMALAVKVVPPLGPHRARAATTAMELKEDMPLLELPPALLLALLPVLLPGNNQLLLVDSLPMEVTVDTPPTPLEWALQWAPLVLRLLVWAHLLPLLVWLRRTMELLAVLPLPLPLVMRPHPRLPVTTLLHPRLPSDQVIVSNEIVHSREFRCWEIKKASKWLHVLVRNARGTMPMVF